VTVDVVPAGLRTLEAVVRYGSFSRAAEAMHLSQPAVSTQVRRLEAGLGVRLIERVGKRALPTAAGDLVLRYGRDAVERFEAGLEALRRLNGTVAGRVRLGTGATVSIHVLPGLLRRVRDRYPAVEFSVVTGNTPEITAAVVGHDLDAALVTLPVHGRELAVSPFFRDELVAVAPPDTRWPRGRAVTSRQIAEQSLILYERGGHVRDIMDRWFHRAGGPVRVTMELGNAEAIKEMVAAGLGVSLISAVAVRREVRTGKLVARRLAPALFREIGLVRRRDKPRTPAFGAFQEILEEYRRTIRTAERLPVGGPTRR
jgi:DNA-binding transcriptional LysR family regulator